MVLDIIILGLSEFKSILEIKGLKQIDIFWVLLLIYYCQTLTNKLKNLLKGVRSYFLLLHHESQFVNIKKNKILGRNKD